MLNKTLGEDGRAIVVRRPTFRAADDARWRDAAAITAALWCFVLLVYLPIIAQLHRGEGLGSVALDCSTFLVSALFAMALFGAFRATARVAPLGRLPLLVAAVLAAAAVQAAFDLLFTGLVADHLQRAWHHMPTDLARGYGAGLRYANVFAVNTMLFQLVASRRRALRQERELVAITATRQRAELDWLRLKLNPHFLFNTLNSISGLVVTGRGAEAEVAIERLSTFLRASLDGDPGAHNTVEEELALAEQYLRIEEMRFGDRLRTTFSCAPAAADMMLPALTVQPLVELAVRDGVGGTAGPVHVTVTARASGGTLEITVADDSARAGGDDLRALADDMRRRLAALHGGDAELAVASDRRATAVTIRVPATVRG